MAAYSHTPVLLQEVLEVLNPLPGQLFVDATLGGGGYTEALIGAVSPKGKVLAIDMDRDAIIAFELRITRSTSSGQANQELRKSIQLVHGNFRDVGEIIAKHKFGPVNGIVADIGFSSYELEAGRGISFQKDEPLDMRFDMSSQEPTAAFMLAEYSEGELANIFKDFGEEHFAKLIARNIVRNRTESPIKRTSDLVEIITASVPGRFRHKAQDSIRRIFQSLRIAVNGELESLERFLPNALDILAPGGILAIVSFHSLEDRMVKQFFAKASRGCICPKDFPVCRCGQLPAGQLLTRKAIVGSASEVSRNSRAKSARLRAIKKL